MHDNELWQVFLENGQPVPGYGVIDDSFAENPLLIMGNAHVWFWRKADASIEILLQKRALTKKTAPGYYHISAAGHINVGETAIETAVRETCEEVGIAIDPTLLYLVHVTRAPRHWQSLLYVYTYELAGNEQFSFDDGEVELVKWYDLKTFCKMTEDADSHMLVDQGRQYFDPLIAAIERQTI